MERYLELFRLTKEYPGADGPVAVVQGFSLDVREGELVALLGHSGCGKSTVLGMVAGLIDNTSGGVVVGEREVSGPGPDRAVVFQSPCLLDWLTVRGNVALGVDRVFAHASRGDRRAIVEHWLSVVGLGSKLDAYPSDLSQGMRQRVGIARAFALAPRVLLLDEPFGMLDSLTRMELQEVLLELLAREHRTALLVTHDIDEALFLADRIVLMTNGPRARVGKILTVPFERPRDRTELFDDAKYWELRTYAHEFLAKEEAGKSRARGTFERPKRRRGLSRIRSRLAEARRSTPPGSSFDPAETPTAPAC